MGQPIINPFPNFVGTQGLPLNAGYVYFGEEGQNPETDPISVYWDEELTLAAIQPVRTLNGYFLKDDAPAQLWTVSQPYSLRVRGLAGEQVVDAPSVTGPLAALAAPGGSALVGFLLDKAGAVARTIWAKLNGWIQPEDFGAVGNGIVNDTPAFQAMIASLRASGGGTIFLGAKHYRIELGADEIAMDIGNGAIQIRGAGERVSYLDHRPSGDGSVVIKLGTGATPIYCQSLRGFTIFGYDAVGTYQKTAVWLRDVAQVTVENIEVRGDTPETPTSGAPRWTGYGGGVAGSIALKINGREAVTVRKVLFIADRPLVMGPNPNHLIAADHFHFQDTYLQGQSASFDLVEIEESPMAGDYPYPTGTFNLTFDGSQPWVGGRHGLYNRDVTTNTVSYNWRFENIRREQQHDDTAPTFNVDRLGTTTGALYGLTVRNFYGGKHNAVDVPGAFLRGIRGSTLFEMFNYAADAGGVAIDVDETVHHLKISSSWFNNGATANFNGEHQKLTWGIAYPSAAIPSDFETLTTLAPWPSLRSEAWHTGKLLAVATGAVASLGTNVLIGTLLIHTSYGVPAIFSLNGSNNSTYEMSDPAAHFSNTKNTALTINIYYEAGEYKIQNLRAADVTFRIYPIGPGLAGFLV